MSSGKETGSEVPPAASGAPAVAPLWRGPVPRLLALAAYLIARLVPTGQPLGWPGDGITAHYLVMARAFNRFGILELRGVPIQNGGALWPEPDIYVNWPPGFPLILSFLLRLPGDDVLVGRIVAALISVATVVVIWLLAKRLWGTARADIVGVAYGTMGVVLTRGSLTTHLSLAVLLMLIAYYVALGGRRRLDTWLSAALFAAACFSSWEPILLLIPLLWLGFVRRSDRWRRIAVAFSVAAAFTLTIILVLYSSAPGGSGLSRLLAQGHDRFAAGLAERNLSAPGERALPAKGLFSTPGEYARMMGHYALECGTAWLLALSFTGVFLWAAMRRHSFVRDNVAVAVLGVPPLFWYAVMSNHAYFHDYEMLLWAPFFALAGATAAHGLLHVEAPEGSSARRYVVALLAVLVLGHLLLGVRMYARLVSAPPSSEVALGEAIRSVTPPDARVLIADSNRIVPWVADRRIYCRIETRAQVQWVLGRLREAGDSAPVYLFGLTEPNTELDRTWPHRHHAGEFWWWRLR